MKNPDRSSGRSPVRRTRIAAPRQRGFTLIEVLIALIVLVLGVLGAAAMTLNALRDNKQSATRSQATALAYELGEMMRMNNGGATAQAVFTGGVPTASASCYGSGCPLATLAANDFAEWISKLQGPGGLPGATYKICQDATNLNSMSTCDNVATSPMVVKLQWIEKNNTGANGALTATNTIADQPSLVVTLRNY